MNYDVINRYQDAMFHLNSKKFNSLLSKRVKLKLNSEISGKTKLSGKDLVTTFYQDNFFLTTKNFSPNSIEIDVTNKRALYKVDALVDKIDLEEDTFHHLRITNSTEFQISKRKKKGKIRKINSTVKAEVIYSFSLTDANKLVEDFFEMMKTDIKAAGEFLTKDFTANVLVKTTKFETAEIISKEEFLSSKIHEIYNQNNIDINYEGYPSFSDNPVSYHQIFYKKRPLDNSITSPTRAMAFGISGEYKVTKIGSHLKIAKASLVITPQP